MDSHPQQNIYQEESIDIKKYFFKFLSNWYWFAIALGISLSVAYLINRYSESTYTIDSSIIISDNQNEASSIESIVQELGRFRARKKTEVVNEIAILKSYKMARLALEELDFGILYISIGKREIAETKTYHNSPFVVIPDTAFTQIINYPIDIKILSEHEYQLSINDQFNIKRNLKFGETFENEAFKFSIIKNEIMDSVFNETSSNKYLFKFLNINNLAKTYRSKLNIDINDEKGSILTLKLNGFVPEKMAAYLNKLSEVYIRSDLTEKNERTENTLSFIDDQLSIIVKDLNNAEVRLQEFRSENQVFNLSQKGGLLINRLSEVQMEQIPYEVRERYFDYLNTYLQEHETNQPIVAPSIMNINDQALQKIIEKYNDQLFQKLKFSQVANEDASNIIILQNEINSLQNIISEYVKTNKQANKISIQALNQKINDINKEINILPVNERILINIEREYTLNNELYTFLLEKRAEAGISKASNVADNKILDIARPENATQLTPKRSQNYLIALVLGFGLPGAIILMLEFFNTKIEDKKDIEQNTDIPIIGTIGHNATQSNIPVFIDPKSGLAESFRTLRTNLQYILREKNQKVIMITSTISGEGKTFAAINLATIIAMTSKKVLLVGLDLRKPSLHKIFDVANDTGISTFLSQQSEYAEIIKETPIENLFIAPSGPIPPNPAELIETKQMKAFFEKAEEDYDFIVIDTPPIALVTDALLISQYSHANLFMIRQRYSKSHVFDLINKLNQDQKISHMNILVNDLKMPKYYGYNYGYNYGYGYGYGYGIERKNN